MASDRTVSSKDVLDALMQLRRRGNDPVLRELEKQEPDLIEFLLEEVTAIHQDLLKLGGQARQTRKLSSRIETMGLVLVTSLRNAHLRLWRQDAAGTPLAQIDPSLGENNPGHEQPPAD